MHRCCAGFGETDITPALDGKPVWLAGFGKGRKATGVHDPLMARAVVFADGKTKIALVAVDLVGLFREPVERVRKQLPGFAYVLVSSTHNHEGPDTLGLWGPNFATSGIDADYLAKVEAGIVAAVRQADKGLDHLRAHRHRHGARAAARWPGAVRQARRVGGAAILR